MLDKVKEAQGKPLLLQTIRGDTGWGHGMMQEHKILLVGRQPSLVKLLRRWLEEGGYTVVDVFDVSKGLREFFRHRPTVVILDMGAHQRESFDLLTQIREGSQVPIILLSGKGTETAKVQGLSGGADDYLVKPLGQMELLARLEAILRRTSQSPSEADKVFTDGVITVDSARHCVYVRGEEVPLTVLEFNLLAALVRYSGQVLSQRSLLDQVWGPEYHACDNVKWHITNLRRKIEEDPQDPKLVSTVRGVGYRYDGPTNGSNGNGSPH